MKVVTADEMRGIDRRTIDEFGISSVALMERAGLAVAEKVRGLFDRGKVIVLAGGGNNGGDGIVAARNLFNWGWNARVFIFSRENKLRTDCLAQYRTARKMKVPLEFRTGVSRADLHSAVVIDAIFGTGIERPVAGPLSDVISLINKSGAPVVSVDIPSGISSDNGQVMGDAIRADYTVTFGLPKIGHLLHPGAEHAGELSVEDIGFPSQLFASDSLKTQTIERGDASILVPPRAVNSYKGDYGHVLIVAGSKGKTGAALMAAKACVRAGAGMVTLGVPETLCDVYQSSIIEEMIVPLPDKGDGTISLRAAETILHFVSEKADVLAVGPGMGTSDDTRKLMRALVAKSAAPMVIDADGINSLEGDAAVLRKVKSPLIFTPHIGELARLLKRGGGESSARLRASIEKDRISIVRFFSKDTGTYLILKGAPTLVAEPSGNIFFNTTGNPGMATAGAGDALTGIISAFVGQHLNPLDASVLGVYIHGLAGDIAASEKGMHSMIASDIIDHLPGAFASLKRE